MRNFIGLLAFAVTSLQASALQVQNIVYPAAATGYIKVFVKPMVSETDILFVVDNSGSMSEHQAKMAANVPVLAQGIADRAGISTHAAILTTDMDGSYAGSQPGNFRSILSSNSPTFSQDLAAAIMVGINGSPIEQHFDAVKAALSSPLLETVNAGFLRPEAHLALIFLTDAEDQSSMQSAAMISFLTSLKGAAGVSAYGFMSPILEGACAKDSPVTEAKLETMINQMGGQVFSICSPDWHAPMISISDKMVTEITRTIRLPTEPVRSSIEVRFGSIKFEAGDLRRGWIYDESNNSILMGDLIDWSGQPAGTELEIKFVPKYWQ